MVADQEEKLDINDIILALEDIQAIKEESCLSQQEQREFKSLEEAKLKDFVQNIRLRKQFSWSLFGLLVFWILFIDLIIVLAGWQVASFCLSEKVLIALITSTTINVIGLFAIVIRNLFPRVEVVKDEKEKKE